MSNNKQTFSLLVYEMVPENTLVFLIPNEAVNKYRHFLQQAHGKMINTPDLVNQGMQFLSAAVCEKEEYVDPEWKNVACIFRKFLWEKDHAIEDYTITAFYLSGFVM